MKILGFAVGTGAFGSCPDRFCPGGYKADKSISSALDEISLIKDLTGIMINFPNPLNENTVFNIQNMLNDRGLKISSCDADLYSNPDFALGSLISENKTIRKKSIDICKRAMDMAENVGATTMNLWPGQDGHDYPFQINYYEQWKLLADAINEIGDHNPRVKLCLEYKPREPRTHSTIANAGIALNLAHMTSLSNVGVTIDLGHSLNCKESPGNIVTLLDLFNKLFAVHLNDNYRDWDDDMAVGTVHFWETLEFFYYLYHSSFVGWLNLDIFPYRENSSLACQTSIDNIHFMLNVVEKIDNIQTLKRYQKDANALGAINYIKRFL
jgi:xylose isomerase